MPSANTGVVKTYFWMVHYDSSPDARPADDGLIPIPAGQRRSVVVINRNLSGNQVIDFNMPREKEASPDAATFRGPSTLRNRIIGFYASAEEANEHLNEKLWQDLQVMAGAVYAELHSMKLDLAGEKPEIMKLVA